MFKKIFLLLGLAIGISGNLHATPDGGGSLCLSSQDLFQSIKGDSAIVRNYENYEVICSKNPATLLEVPFTNTFVIINRTTSDTVYFITDFGGLTAINPYSCYIKDMEIYDGVCYFCGVKHVDYGAPVIINDSIIEPRFKSFGFVGRFSINAILSGSREVYHYQVPQTRELNRLAISEPTAFDGLILISAVGTKEGNNDTACLAELYYLLNFGNRVYHWDCIVSNLSQQNVEVFADILSTESKIIMASRLKCEDDYYSESNPGNHLKFNLYNFSLNGCYHDEISNNLLLISEYTIAQSDYGWHLSDANMNLCRWNGSSFFLSYGYVSDFTMQGGARIFAFNNIYSSDSSISYPLGKNTQIKDMRNKRGRGEIFLLHTDDDHPRGVTSIPYWGRSSTNSVYEIESAFSTIHSLDLHSNIIDMVGYDNMILTLFRQFDAHQCYRVTTCFREWESNFEKHGKKNGVEHSRSWKHILFKDFHWIRTEIELDEPVHYRVCSQ